MRAKDSISKCSPPPRSRGPLPGAQKCVLIAEDSDILRTVMVHALNDAGYRVLSAPDGALAWKIAAKETGIDLLITDFKMPGVDGVELAYRFHQGRPRVPVILISALCAQARTELRDFSGRIECLEKPFFSTELVAKVHSVLDDEGSALPG